MGETVTAVGSSKKNKVVKQPELKKHAATIHCSNTLSLLQRKISNALLYHAYKELMLKEEHEITVKQLCKLISYQGNNHAAIKGALKDLLSTVIEWNVVNDLTGTEDWTASSMLASVSLQGPICLFAYSPRMKQLLHSPSMFGKINLVVQSKFKSSYGLALYENCTRYRGLPYTKWFDMEMFRKLMGVPEGKYGIFRDFKRRILDKSVEEVNAYSDLIVEPELGKEGRKVTRIRFCLRDKDHANVEYGHLEIMENEIEAEVCESDNWQKLNKSSRGSATKKSRPNKVDLNNKLIDKKLIEENSLIQQHAVTEDALSNKLLRENSLIQKHGVTEDALSNKLLRENALSKHSLASLSEDSLSNKLARENTLRKHSIAEEGSFNSQMTENTLKNKLFVEYGVSKEQIKEMISQYSADFILEKIHLIENSKNFKEGKVNNLAAYLMSAVKKNFQSAKTPAKRKTKTLKDEEAIDRFISLRREVESLRDQYQSYKEKFTDAFLAGMNAKKKKSLMDAFHVVAEKSINTVLQLQRKKYTRENVLESPQIKGLLRQFAHDYLPQLKVKMLSFENFIQQLSPAKKKAWSDFKLLASPNSLERVVD